MASPLRVEAEKVGICDEAICQVSPAETVLRSGVEASVSKGRGETTV